MLVREKKLCLCSLFCDNSNNPLMRSLLYSCTCICYIISYIVNTYRILHLMECVTPPQVTKASAGWIAASHQRLSSLTENNIA